MATGLIALLLGALGLLGWVLPLPVLTSVLPRYQAIAPSSACALVVLGLLTVWVASGRGRLAAVAVAGVVSLYGLVEVIGFAVGADLNREDALTRYLARVWSRPFTTMSPAAGALMFLVGAALLALLLAAASRSPLDRSHREKAGILGAAAAVGALVFVLGYLYDAPLLYHTRVIPIAATTSLGFLLLGVGAVAAAGPDRWPLRVCTGASVRARLLRAFVPLTVLAVLLSSLLREWMPAAAHLNHALESSLLATAFALIVGVVGYRIAAVLGSAIEAAQTALQESEARLHLAQEAAQAGTWEWDLRTNANTWSEELWKLYGLAPHSVAPSYQAWLATIHPEDRARAEQSVQEAARSGNDLSAEWRVRDPDGSERWLMSRGQPVYEAQGKRVERYLGIVLDITERVQAEQERERLLREIERQRLLLNAIVENTEAHLVYLDRNFNFIWVNPAYARACRKPQEEFVGHNHFEFYPHPENEAIFRRVRDTGVPFSIREKPFEFPDMPERGTTYWDWTLTPINDGSGAVVALVFSLADVTEMVRARQQVEQAERQRAEEARLFATVLDNARPLLASLDRDLRFVQVNEGYAQFAGVAPRDLVGRRWDEVWHDPARVAAFVRARDTGRAQEAQEQRLENPRRPGEAIYVDWSLVPVKDDRGETQLVVISATDVTERVRARDRLLEAERRRTELAETMNREIAHRVKNNLAMVASLLQMQITERPEGETPAILRSAISRLQAFADVHEEMQTVGEGDLDLLAVVRRIAAANRDAAARGPVLLSVGGEPARLPLRSATHLAVVANELISNAVRHGAPDGSGDMRVDVSVYQGGGRLRLSVWNSGNAVPVGFDASRQRNLGLRLVWGLTVEQYGGTFALWPHADGTMAEVVVEERRLR